MLIGKWVLVTARSSGQPPRNEHTTVTRRRHYDGEQVIHSTNAHLVLITRLLSLRKFSEHFTKCVTIDDTKRWLYVREVLVLRWLNI